MSCLPYTTFGLLQTGFQHCPLTGSQQDGMWHQTSFFHLTEALCEGTLQLHQSL